MITPAYARLMAAYNAEMNRRMYAAADTLDDAARRLDRGAFFGSIHGTLNHLLWADRQWMSRFAGWPKPPVLLAESPRMIEEHRRLEADRFTADAAMIEWTGSLQPAALSGDLTWFSGSSGAETTRPFTLLVVHMFNHQIHHRGQVHAMLTSAGATTGATDLPFILPAEAYLA